MVVATIFEFAVYGRFCKKKKKKKLCAIRAITKNRLYKELMLFFFFYYGYAIQYEALSRADVEAETIITLLQQCYWSKKEKPKGEKS